MAIKLTCRCGTKLKIPASRAGTTGNCPRCGASLEVPETKAKRQLVRGRQQGAPASDAGAGMKGKLLHLWATRRTLAVIMLMGAVSISAAGVAIVVLLHGPGGHGVTRRPVDPKVVRENESARRAKLQRARELAADMRFAEALTEAEAAAALGAKMSFKGARNHELWSETRDLVLELTWKKQVAGILTAWLTDMSKGNPTAGYWGEGLPASTLFAVRSWQLLQLSGSESGPIFVRVRVDSSNKGGARITKDWSVMLRRGGVRGYELMTLSAE